MRKFSYKFCENARVQGKIFAKIYKIITKSRGESWEILREFGFWIRDSFGYFATLSMTA